jgi:cobalt-zinc-cadmium efflux system outer membrane protein
MCKKIQGGWEKVIKTKNSLKQLLIFSQILLLAGCVVHSVHNESYVSDAITDRTGHELRWEAVEGVLQLPEGIALDDGLTEDEAVAIALWNNAQFQADIVQLGFARADLIEAGLLRNPVLSLLFPLGPKQLEATLNLPVEFLWQRPKRVAAAKLNAEKVADSLIQNGLDLIRDAMIAYTELEFARERAEITAEEAALRREIADIAAARLKVGDISGLEETAFHLEAAQTLEASVLFFRDAQLAEERLKNVLGLGWKEVTIQLSPVTSSNEITRRPSDLLAAAFAARPDLRAAEIAIEAAGQRIGWERSKIFNLTAMLDANGEGKEGFEMGPGIQMELPILNQNNGKVARAQAELAQAARQYLAVKHRIAREVLEAHAHYLAAQKALNILQADIMPAATTAAANATEAYAIGAISYLELLDFKRQLLNSRLREAEAKADLRRAEVNLEHSVGFKPETE